MTGEHRPDRAGDERAAAPGRPVRQVRDLEHLVAMAAQQLRQRGFVVPARMAAVDPRAAADTVHEVRDRERVRGREHEPAAGHEVTARRVEETTGARQVLDELARPHDVEGAPDIERLRVRRDHVGAALRARAASRSSSSTPTARVATDATAAACRLSPRTIRRKIAEGVFPNAYKAGEDDAEPSGIWMIPVADLEAAGLDPTLVHSTFTHAPRGEHADADGPTVLELVRSDR